MTQTIHRVGTRYPFSKLKPGMQVVMAPYPECTGTLVGKHNGMKYLYVLYPGGEDVTHHLPYEDYLGTPEPDPLDQIHPMLAKDISKRKTLSVEEVLESPEWALEEKYDGERQILTFVPDHGQTGPGAEYVYSKWFTERAAGVWFRANTRVVGKNSGRLATNSETIQHLADLPVPFEGVTVLDVELMHRDGFQRLRSIMGSLPERALELQREHEPVFAIVFDVLWFGGEDLRARPFHERRSVLTDWYLDEVEEGDYPLILSPFALNAEDKRHLLDHVLQYGGEGAMVKRMDGLYTDTTRSGQRSSDVLKVKPFTEDDVIIYGFEQGKGEYNQHKFGAIQFAQIVRREDMTPEMAKNVLRCGSSLGAATCAFPDEAFVHMGSCSGITDEQEAAFRADPASFIGRVMEVRFQQRWPDTGLMRHPNFVRLRDDKSPAECVYGRDA